jgi:hypothetical protein
MHRIGVWVFFSLLVLTSCQPVAEPLAGGRAGASVDGGGATFSDIFTISASVSETGEVTGYLAVKNPPEYTPAYAIEGPATCLNVVGTRATIGGLLERFEQDDFPNPARYRGWLFYVDDNADQNGRDTISYQWLYEAPVIKCPAPTPGSAVFQMTQGHVRVTEGRA